MEGSFERGGRITCATENVHIIKIYIYFSCEIKFSCRNSSLQAVCHTPISRVLQVVGPR